MCADSDRTFNLKLFSPLKTPKDYHTSKANKVKDSDVDSDVSVLTKDIRKVVKTISDKVNTKMSEDSDTSLFKTQLFPSQQSEKRDEDISSSDVSSSEESDLDLEELKRDLAKKEAARKQTLLNESVELRDKKKSNTLKQSPNIGNKQKQTPNSGNKQKSNLNTSGFTALKRKSSGSSDSEDDSDSNRSQPIKKPKLNTTGPSLGQSQRKGSTKLSNDKDDESGDDSDSNRSQPVKKPKLNTTGPSLGQSQRKGSTKLSNDKDDVVGNNDSSSDSSDSESDSSDADLNDINSVLKRTKGILKDQKDSPAKKTKFISNSPNSDANNNDKNSGLKSPKEKGSNISMMEVTSASSENRSQTTLKCDKPSEKADVRMSDSDSDSDSDSSSKSSVVSDQNSQCVSSVFKDNAEQAMDVKNILQADLDSSDKQSYQPPKGFQPVDFKTKRLVKMERLKGKQLFLIKAPTKIGRMNFGGQKIDLNGSTTFCDEKSKTDFVVNVNRNPSKEVQNFRCLDMKNDSSGNKLCIGPHVNGVIHIKAKPPKIPEITYTKQLDFKHKVTEVTRRPMQPFSSGSPVRELLTDEIVTQSRKKKKIKTAVLDDKIKTAVLDDKDDFKETDEIFSSVKDDEAKRKKKKKRKEKISDYFVESDKEKSDSPFVNEKDESKKAWKIEHGNKSGKESECVKTESVKFELKPETDTTALALSEVSKKKKKKKKKKSTEVE